jgi:hypothetical protein
MEQNNSCEVDNLMVNYCARKSTTGPYESILHPHMIHFRLILISSSPSTVKSLPFKFSDENSVCNSHHEENDNALFDVLKIISVMKCKNEETVTLHI